MELSQHYDSLYRTAVHEINNERLVVDSMLDSESDERRGITLLIRPDDEVKEEISRFLSVLEDVEPDQYYYPESDFHITVMSLISCYDGFSYDQIDLSRYAEIVKESIADVGVLGFDFKGITASPSCVMIQGFPTGTGLNILRDRLRENFRNSDLEQSLDKRYKLQTAHSTVVRFRKPLVNKRRFLKVLEAYRDCNFGTFRADALELVYNDWYQKAKLVEKLHTFSL